METTGAFHGLTFHVLVRSSVIAASSSSIMSRSTPGLWRPERPSMAWLSTTAASN